MGDLRKAEILDGNKWKEIDFKDIKQGHIFRLYEDNEELVQDIGGETTFLAKSKAYYDDETGVFCIETEGIELKKGGTYNA